MTLKTQQIAAAGFLLLLAALAPLARAAETVDACTPGEAKCSDDGYILLTCGENGWEKTNCMSAGGQLCEAGACVDPWRYGAPQWPRVEDEPRATKETLREKAEAYQKLVRQLHIHPDLKWTMGVTLPCKPVACMEGEEPPCLDCTQPSVPIEEATWRDVETWHSGENDGLFSALQLAAEAFRYAVTKEPEALGAVKLLLDGEVTRMRITGVPGNFTRQFIPPDIPGLKQPDKLGWFMPDAEKDDNKWVRVGPGGCAQIVDPATQEWVTTNFCDIPEEFEGWVWLDNVSKDEYSGHMFALGAVAKLVDDPQVQATVKDLLRKVAHHLIDHNLTIVDWDGRVTEHGSFWALAADDFPGFNAAMALNYIQMAAETTGDADLMEFYEECLLQKTGGRECLPRTMEAPADYTSYLKLHGLYWGEEGCQSNYNNISMHMLSMHNLIWFERRAPVKAKMQKELDRAFNAKGQPRALANQNNAFFDFIWASQKKLGPESDGPAYTAVENGIRMLRQFRPTQTSPDLDCPPDNCENYCLNRFENWVGERPREIADRCPSVFVWWGDPYGLGGCKANGRVVHQPAGYLLPYWMGRYYGFIAEDM